MPGEVFADYIKLFEEMPNMLFFDELMFVHGGIPRDVDIKAKLARPVGLNDPDIRFQMMWSDPSTADVIPAELQEQSARFPFGKLQFQRSCRSSAARRWSAATRRSTRASSRCTATRRR